MRMRQLLNALLTLTLALPPSGSSSSGTVSSSSPPKSTLRQGGVSRLAEQPSQLSECMADDGGQYSAYSFQCVFPFTYKSVTYHACTETDHNRPWCRINGVFGDWGNCEASDACLEWKRQQGANICMSDGLFDDSFTTPCFFPFLYRGIMYNSCTTTNHDRPWCAVESGLLDWANCESSDACIRGNEGSNQQQAFSDSSDNSSTSLAPSDSSVPSLSPVPSEKPSTSTEPTTSHVPSGFPSQIPTTAPTTDSTLPQGMEPTIQPSALPRDPTTNPSPQPQSSSSVPPTPAPNPSSAQPNPTPAPTSVGSPSDSPNSTTNPTPTLDPTFQTSPPTQATPSQSPTPQSIPSPTPKPTHQPSSSPRTPLPTRRPRPSTPRPTRGPRPATPRPSTVLEPVTPQPFLFITSDPTAASDTFVPTRSNNPAPSEAPSEVPTVDGSGPATPSSLPSSNPSVSLVPSRDENVIFPSVTLSPFSMFLLTRATPIEETLESSKSGQSRQEELLELVQRTLLIAYERELDEDQMVVVVQLIIQNEELGGNPIVIAYRILETVFFDSDVTITTSRSDLERITREALEGDEFLMRLMNATDPLLSQTFEVSVQFDTVSPTASPTSNNDTEISAGVIVAVVGAITALLLAAFLGYLVLFRNGRDRQYGNLETDAPEDRQTAAPVGLLELDAGIRTDTMSTPVIMETHSVDEEPPEPLDGREGGTSEDRLAFSHGIPLTAPRALSTNDKTPSFVRGNEENQDRDYLKKQITFEVGKEW